MQKYGAIKNGELLVSNNLLQGYKPIEYEKIPKVFDQVTQYITQSEPIDRDDRIYIGIEMHELDLEDEEFDEGIF
jgi:hypothetical protein